jgi:hypothetical protein
LATFLIVFRFISLAILIVAVSSSDANSALLLARPAQLSAAAFSAGLTWFIVRCFGHGRRMLSTSSRRLCFGSNLMRRFLFAASAASILIASGKTSAVAQDYPWCLQGKEWGYPGLCHFVSYGQCLATASGTFSYCGIDPRFAFASQRRGDWRGPAQPMTLR